MASFKKINGGWQAQVAIKGTREARNFSTKAEATSWTAERETEIQKQHETGIDLSKTVGDAFDRYGTEVSPRKKRDPIWTGSGWVRRLSQLDDRVFLKNDFALPDINSHLIF